MSKYGLYDIMDEVEFVGEGSTLSNITDISIHSGGSVVDKARKRGCATKCAIIILIGCIYFAIHYFSEIALIKNLLSKIQNNGKILPLIIFMIPVIWGCLGYIMPDRSEIVCRFLNKIDKEWLVAILKHHLPTHNQDKTTRKKTAVTYLKEHPITTKQKKCYLIVYLLVSALTIVIVYCLFSLVPPTTGGTGAGSGQLTTTVPTTTTTESVPEPTPQTPTVPDTVPSTPVSDGPTVIIIDPPPTPPGTQPSVPEPPVTTTTAPFEFDDNYTYTYTSIKDNEYTTATVTGKAITKCYSIPEDGNLVIPDDVVIICENVFNSFEIKSLTLSNSLQVIGECAFGDGASFGTVSLPTGLRYIGAYAFNTTNRTFYINDSPTNFKYRMRFGTPYPFGDWDSIEIWTTDDTVRHTPADCKNEIREYVDKIMNAEDIDPPDDKQS